MFNRLGMSKLFNCSFGLNVLNDKLLCETTFHKGAYMSSQFSRGVEYDVDFGWSYLIWTVGGLY